MMVEVTGYPYAKLKTFFARPKIVGFLLGCATSALASLAISICFSASLSFGSSISSLENFLWLALIGFILLFSLSIIPAGIGGWLIGHFVIEREKSEFLNRITPARIGVVVGAITGFLITQIGAAVISLLPHHYWNFLIFAFAEGDVAAILRFLRSHLELLWRFGPVILIMILTAMVTGRWIALFLDKRQTASA